MWTTCGENQPENSSLAAEGSEERRPSFTLGVTGSLQLKHAAVPSAATLLNLQVVSACLDLRETFTARVNAASASHSNLRLAVLSL